MVIDIGFSMYHEMVGNFKTWRGMEGEGHSHVEMWIALMFIYYCI
jgi:hypothetical protein